MKQTLTIEQSAELIKRGVSERRATSSVWSPSENAYIHPTFTLADLFTMLPKGIIHNGPSCKLRIISWYDEPWFVGYENQVGKYIMSNPYDAPFSADELIDVIFQLLCWAIDNGHVKLD